MKNSIAIILTVSSLKGADWPTWRGDNLRSGVSSESADASTMSQLWVYQEPVAPQPAWHGTMQRDAWNNVAKAKAARAYDKSFNLIVAGGRVFLASSSGNACVALNASNGTQIWRRAVGGSVRLAPTYHAGNVYFGSDDGKVYCVDAGTGAKQWSYRGAADKKLIPADNKFISRYPCRTGVLIQGGKAWCGFGLLPWQDNYLAALDPATGSPILEKTVSAAQWHSLEGPMLASTNSLFVLQGRVSPLYFNLTTGNLQGRLPGGGGTFALLTANGRLIHGPGHGNNTWAQSRTFHLQESNASTGAAVTRHSRAHRMLVNGSDRYVIIRDAIQASGASTWSQTMAEPDCLILAGNVLFVGGKKTVMALNTSDGAIIALWPVDGNVHAMALSDGRLLASTHTGKVYCFE